MKSLSKEDLNTFQQAIFKDYGIKLEGEDLYNAAFNLLQFIETLIKFREEDKAKGSKTIQDNPLNIVNGKDKIE